MKSAKSVSTAARRVRAVFRELASDKKRSKFDYAYALGMTHGLEWVLEYKSINSLIRLAKQNTN